MGTSDLPDVAPCGKNLAVPHSNRRNTVIAGHRQNIPGVASDPGQPEISLQRMLGVVRDPAQDLISRSPIGPIWEQPVRQRRQKSGCETAGIDGHGPALIVVIRRAKDKKLAGYLDGG